MLTPRLLFYWVNWADSEDNKQEKQEQEFLWGGFAGGSGLGKTRL